MAYDVLIKSGLVIDGSGKAPEVMDIGVTGEKISAIGDLGRSSAKTVIDAHDKYVTPGFIDMTNHSDTHLTLFKYPHLESLVMQGVTTIIGGNCGASLAPLASSDAIGAIQKWADPSEININWTDTQSFLQEIEQFKLGVNFGMFLGHGTLRRGIIGNEIRPLNIEEREQMKYLIREGMKQGAFGLSLGLAYGHERAATTEELIDIAGAVRESGGLLKVHLRSEAGGLVASINEMIRIGRESGVPIHISHLKAIGKKAWPLLQKALDLIDHAKSSGVAISFDVSPYHTTGSLLYLLVPLWARQGGFTELFKRIDDPAERLKIIEALKRATFHYDKILITSAKLKNGVGRTLAEIAQETSLPPEEALLETIRANEGRVSIIGKTVSNRNTTLEIIHPDAVIASDGEGYSQDAFRLGNLAHPRSFGTFPHFWHRFVTDNNVLTPADAIKKITSQPAALLHIRQRGILKKENFADIAVFDPKLFREKATYLSPFRYPSGIEYVLVNGRVEVAQGQHVGARAGTIVKPAA